MASVSGLMASAASAASAARVGESRSVAPRAITSRATAQARRRLFGGQGNGGGSKKMRRAAEGEAAAAASVEVPVEVPLEKSSTAFSALKNIDDIMGILPHRFPFLLVDRVVEIEEGKSIVGYKNVTINDNFFPGHFPERPIMPGVLQVEAMAQLAGILMLEGADISAKQNFFFGGVDNCKFRKPVVPGDTLMMKVVIKKFKKKLGICKCHGECYVGGDVVCEADMTLVLTKEG